MSDPRTSTCEPWALPSDLAPPWNSYGTDSGHATDALQFATDVLYNLTGRRWPGHCTATKRPCARIGGSTISTLLGGIPLAGTGGGWAGSSLDWEESWGSCGCNREERTGCGSLPEITLGVDRLVSIQQIKVDGVVLDPSLYQIEGSRWLVRLANPDKTNPGWPCCQRMDLPDTEPGTWSVQFTYGTQPAVGGKVACAALASELLVSIDPTREPAKCRLPNRVTSVTRQGVTMQLLDPTKVFPDGLTGLPEVDLWITSVNRAKLQRRARASSPDIGRRTRTVTWPP